MKYMVGAQYTRKDVQSILGVSDDVRGGDWDKGYHKHHGEWYIFSTTGNPNRTDHEYGDPWGGDLYYWRDRSNSKVSHPKIKSMTVPNARVHLFVRNGDRMPFTYRGLVKAKEVQDITPVAVIGESCERGAGKRGNILVNEVVDPQKYYGGALRQIFVNNYERSPQAWEACLMHYGAKCCVCGFDFSVHNGELGLGFMHVHHVKLLSEIKNAYIVDPIKDLRPSMSQLSCHDPSQGSVLDDSGAKGIVEIRSSVAFLLYQIYKNKCHGGKNEKCSMRPKSNFNIFSLYCCR